MASPQPGIFGLGTSHHIHLELNLTGGPTSDELAAAVARLRESAVTTGGANIVVGFGAATWAMLADTADQPLGLAPFAPIGRAPATQHDLWVWVHGSGRDVVFDIARAAVAALAPVAELVAEQDCFLYRDSRDLTGFIDGTENPPVEEAVEVALVADGEPGAGGSFVITQRWVHDLISFHALSIDEQQNVFGRTKPDSIEMADDVKPPTAHIARVVIQDDQGEEIEIFRRSAPYGSVRELGLYFVAFAREPRRFTTMLQRMFGQTDDGLHDRLTDFTKPVSGAFYFAPSLAALAKLGKGQTDG
ncbi:MAG: porphyrinogen peroxidase [Acidimicrobiaceae bacterium]